MTQRQHVTKMKDKWTGLLIGHGKKVKFRGTFMDKFVEKSADFITETRPLKNVAREKWGTH